jgi:hypothetical protein
MTVRLDYRPAMELRRDDQANGGSFLVCRRCGLAVSAGAEQYDVFEQMHYVCFHYEFEHKGDPDVECAAGGCPAAGASVPAAWVRVSGVDLVHAGDTVVPAILALEAVGYTVTQEEHRFVATMGGSRFAAEDPVAVVGLVKLAETRRPWRASDQEMSDAMDRFHL